MRHPAAHSAVTLCRAALGFSFSVSSDNEYMRQAARTLFADLSPAAEPVHAFHIEACPDGNFSVTADGVLVAEHIAHVTALGTLVWLVNQGVLANPGQLLLFHAAALAGGDEGVLFPAPSGSGKSTLAGALVALGLRYLSDEVGALDPVTMRLSAYPKPLSLGPGSMAALSAFGVRDELGRTATGFTERQLPATAIRLGSVPRSCMASMVLFPELALGESSALHRLRPAQALARLVPNTFNLADRPQEHLEACAELCRRAQAYRLVVGDLATACSAVFDLLGAQPVGGLAPWSHR
jgi:hypothetical protein